MFQQVVKEFAPKVILNDVRALNVFSSPLKALFPEINVQGLDFEYLKGQVNAPVIANIHAQGSEAEILGRDGLNKIKGEIPSLKKKIKLDEKMIVALRRAGKGDYDMVKNTVFNDINLTVGSIQAGVEYMRAQLLEKGSIAHSVNGQIATIDYSVPANHKVILDASDTVSGFWSYANSNPVQKLQEWVDLIGTDANAQLAFAFATTEVISKVLTNTNVRKSYFGDNGASRVLTLAQLNEMLTSLGLPNFVRYDVRARIENADGTFTNTKLFSNKKVSLIPADALGKTLFGPTAEALMDASLEEDMLAGVYATVYAKNDPPELWTKACASVIPVLQASDSILQAQVLA